MSLSRLIYVSTARYDLATADLQAILAEARTRNAEEDVTGLLICNGPNFMQLLEGPRAAVEEIFSLICGDDRHSGVVRILAEPAQTRLFGGWDMAFGEVTAFDGGEPRNVFHVTAGELDALLPDAMPAPMRALFASFNTMSPAATARRGGLAEGAPA